MLFSQPEQCSMDVALVVETAVWVAVKVVLATTSFWTCKLFRTPFRWSNQQFGRLGGWKGRQFGWLKRLNLSWQPKVFGCPNTFEQCTAPNKQKQTNIISVVERAVWEFGWLKRLSPRSKGRLRQPNLSFRVRGRQIVCGYCVWSFGRTPVRGLGTPAVFVRHFRLTNCFLAIPPSW